jgi:hypothetical protein
LTDKKDLEDFLKIISKRNITERQNKGENVEVSEIFDEADEIGKMLEKNWGAERVNAALNVNAALKKLEKEEKEN